MYRQVLIATNNQLVLQLPNEMVGKRVEIIAKPIEVSTLSDKKRRQEIGKIFSDCRVSLSEYTFNRDDANNYNG